MHMNEKASNARLIATVAILSMVLCAFAVAVQAQDSEAVTSINIDSNEDLVNAIANQADGQTWVFTKSGLYDAFNASN